MTILRDLLPDLTLAKPVGYERILLHPLKFKKGPKVDYLTLEDKTANHSVTVEEASEGGMVSRLRVRNGTAENVFVLDGTTLIGAKQNRVVNLSVLLAPQSVTEIPVSCVERGRWRYTSQAFRSSWPCDIELRGKMCAQTTGSLKAARQVRVNQAEVWSHVDGILHACGANSPTAAYHASFAQWDKKLTDYQKHLKVPQDACGVAVEVDGAPKVLDLFDKPETLGKLWLRLVRSYSMAAMTPYTQKSPANNVKSFIDPALAAPLESFQAVGLGTTARFQTGPVAGAALLCDGSVVHLSLFANGHGRTAPGQWEAGTFRVNPPRRRPWWRFWD
jgi:hypothetical protein